MMLERCLMALFAGAMAAGCSSVTSLAKPSPGVNGGAGAGEGLVYFLPRRDILITVTRDATKYTDLAVDVTPPFADRRSPFLLQYQRNHIGENKLTVGVSPGGLLTVLTSQTTPKLQTALETAAATFGEISSLAANAQIRQVGEPSDKCDTEGVYTYVYPLPALKGGESGWSGGRMTCHVCGDEVELSIRRLWDWDEAGAKADAADSVSGARSGLFYRQELPYLVSARSTVKGNSLRRAKIVGSPSASPTRFLPIERTLFATNLAEITFTDGVPSKYQQDTDGEATALLVLPAAILKAYFAAIGAVFAGRSGNDEAQTSALKSEYELKLTKLKLRTCLAAVQKNQGKVPEGVDCEFD